MRPLVSVIIPVHNGARYIREAIDSVLIQNVPLEILVVDDNSDDGLDEALSVYDGSITVLRNGKTMGAAASRNRGVRSSSGKYIAFLDCDDWWEPDKLKKQITLMRKTGCVLCATGRRLVTPEGRKTRRVIRVRPLITYNSLLRQNPINCSSVVLLREVAVMYPMIHDEFHEDYITWLRILRRYRKACAIDEPLLNYRLSNKGKSGSKLRSAYMTFRVYRYMGFSLPKSLACFIAYMVNGFLKYYVF